MMGGQKQSDKQTTTQEPWKAQRPHLQYGFNEARDIYNEGAPGYFPGQTYADPSQITQGVWDATLQRAMDGNPVQNASEYNLINTALGGYLGNNPGNAMYQSVANSYNPAFGMSSMFGAGATPEQMALTQFGLQGGQNSAMDMMRSIAGGDMLNANPYLDSMFDRAAGRVEDRFRTITAPQTDSAAAAAGQYGSSTYQRMRGLNEQSLAGELGGLASDIYSGNFARERGAQDAAQQALAGLTQAGYGQQLGALGQSLGTQLQGTGMMGDVFQNMMANRLAAGGAMDSAFGDERKLMADSARTALGYSAQDWVDLQNAAGVGAQHDALNQARINEDIERYNYEQNADWAHLANYMNMINGSYGGTMTSTGGAGGGGFNPMGGLMGGLGAYGALGGAGMTMAANPMMFPLLIGGGALMGSGLLG